jgi:hypothetical protein
MSDRDFQERRKHPRYAASLNVSFVFSGGKKKSRGDRRISGSGRNISGRTGDISFEGVLVKANPLHADVSSFFLNHQTEEPMFVVDLEIELDGTMIRAEGQMRWFKLWFTGQEPYQLETGISLRQMDSESRKSWDEYFKKLKS